MLATKHEQALSEKHHTTTTAVAAAAVDARLSPSVRHLTNRSGFRIRILQPPFSFIYIIHLLPFPLLRTDIDLEPITN
jgi:hypothetical protein